CQGRQARHKLRHAQQRGGLRPPHRPHWPRWSDGQVVQLLLRQQRPHGSPAGADPGGGAAARAPRAQAVRQHQRRRGRRLPLPRPRRGRRTL
ncbi:hypothetical protein H632_c5253p0, partial [Helicosporidium sp. ATCC 50920]